MHNEIRFSRLETQPADVENIIVQYLATVRDTQPVNLCKAVAKAAKFRRIQSWLDCGCRTRGIRSRVSVSHHWNSWGAKLVQTSGLFVSIRLYSSLFVSIRLFVKKRTGAAAAAVCRRLRSSWLYRDHLRLIQLVMALAYSRFAGQTQGPVHKLLLTLTHETRSKPLIKNAIVRTSICSMFFKLISLRFIEIHQRSSKTPTPDEFWFVNLPGLTGTISARAAPMEITDSIKAAPASDLKAVINRRIRSAFDISHTKPAFARKYQGRTGVISKLQPRNFQKTLDMLDSEMPTSTPALWFDRSPWDSSSRHPSGITTRVFSSWRSQIDPMLVTSPAWLRSCQCTKVYKSHVLQPCLPWSYSKMLMNLL